MLAYSTIRGLSQFRNDNASQKRDYGLGNIVSIYRFLQSTASSVAFTVRVDVSPPKQAPERMREENH